VICGGAFERFLAIVGFAANMSRTSVFTSITPLPAGITRQSVLDTYHNHTEMIELNPLVVERFRCKPPNYAPAEEFHSTWYTIKGTSTSHTLPLVSLRTSILTTRVDKVSYLPGGLANGSVSYHACFHDLPEGLQTHVYAPLGLDIRAKWSVGGSLPGEPKAPVELGIGAPREGLYIREDVRMKCNIMMMGFVKKTFKESHAKLVDRLVEKAHILESEAANARLKMLKEVAPGERMGHGSIFIAPPPGYTPMEQPPQQGPDDGYFPGASQSQQQSGYRDQQRQDSVFQSPQPQPSQLYQPLPAYQEIHQEQRNSGTSSHASSQLQNLHHQSLSSNASSNQSPMSSPNLSQASTLFSHSHLLSPPPLFSQKPLPSPPSQFQQARYQHKHTHSEDFDRKSSFLLNNEAQDAQGPAAAAETRPRSSTIATAKPADEQQSLATLPATTYLPSTTYTPPTLPATTYLPASTYAPRERSRSRESGAFRTLAPPPAELPGSQTYPEDSPVLGRQMKFAAELPG
jgi:hypothetical protein